MSRRGALIVGLLSGTVFATSVAAQSRDGASLVLDAGLSGVYDSNINRDRNELDLYGGSFELLVRFANRTRRPTFQLEYAATGRESSPVTVEKQLGQRLSALAAVPFGSGARLELIGRANDGSTDEDMNSGREFTVMSRLELELSRAHRLRLYGTRLWRDDAPPTPPTPGWQAGAEYRMRLGDAVTFTSGYRYELLETPDTTRQWRRSGASVELAARVTQQSALELGGRYRMRDYPYRFVHVGEEQQLRHDEDWRASLGWVYRTTSGTELRLGYEQEARTSNDVRRHYDAHRIQLSMRRTLFRWRGGGNAPRIDDDQWDVVGGARSRRNALSFAGLAAFGTSVCGLSAEGVAHCWSGSGGPQRQGVRAPTGERWQQLAAGPQRVCGLTAAGAAYCWTPGSMDATPLPVRGGHTFTSIAIGQEHACALTADARAFCWGSNRHGALGSGKFTDSWEPVPVSGDLTFRTLAAGARHTCGIATEGVVYCWGSNAQGQLGRAHVQRAVEPVPLDSLRLVSISAGTNHTCGVDRAGRAWCWGENGRGQLGIGTAGAPATPQLVRADAPFVSVTAGWAHTCALGAEGQAYCWGQNRYGQLGGVADDLSHVTPEPVSGRGMFTALSASFNTCGLRASGQVECWGGNAGGGAAPASRD